jgi:glutamyl-Q tRNA(Asp) synthetase
MASYLDARAHGGLWLVRIEDVDEDRTVEGADHAILGVLQRLGMHWDGEVVWQSRRKEVYAAAAQRIAASTYPCGCNRREIADSRLGVAPDGSAIYPGTCRHGLAEGRTGRSLRVRVPDAPADRIEYTDRLMGPQGQSLATESGDFVLKRGDGFWAYQLAVVVDDAEQGVTDVVRGADLIDSTPRQIYLQHLLRVPTPRYLHVPVVRAADGQKLSKQTGAQGLLAPDAASGLRILRESARFLQLDVGETSSVGEFWKKALAAWAASYLAP